jgi:hypothetical protein
LADQKALEAQQKENEARELEEQLREAKMRVGSSLELLIATKKRIFHPITETGNSYLLIRERASLLLCA